MSADDLSAFIGGSNGPCVAPWNEIARGISEAIDAPFSVESSTPLGGGCINRAYRMAGSGRVYFVKVNGRSRLPMFEAEAAGLAEISRSGTIRVPVPLCCGAAADASWIVLEHVDLGPPQAGSMRAFGHQLARMHRQTGRRFGWERDNTIGATPQRNTPDEDWIAFWREHRLAFQLELAAMNGHRGRLQRRGRLLMEKLPVFFEDHSPQPSLLHGDLWGGNAGFDAQGAPVIYDPAVYYGDREADLAMTELFGGFAPDFYAAYEQEYPLDPGYGQRKALYNLYHVLNHLNLFGGGYGAQAERMIERLLSEA
jgi:fructosamine-3-kinase